MSICYWENAKDKEVSAMPEGSVDGSDDFDDSADE